MKLITPPQQLKVESDSDKRGSDLKTPAPKTPHRNILFERIKRLVSAELILVTLSLAIIVNQLVFRDGLSNLLQDIRPVKAYDFQLSTQFEPDNSDVNIYTYFPTANARQTILDQNILTNQSGSVFNRIEQDESGNQLHWLADESANHTQYKVKVLTSPVRFELAEDLSVPTHYASKLEPYLAATETVQSDHPEIAELWRNIKPTDASDIKAILAKIYDYTYQGIESVDFKGTTDALTASRLGIASCNGKSRLFVALARLNHIPARLVGGVILDGKEKKTSHQWVEAYIAGHWIPFGPTNGHFASIPDNYLRLYTGDQVLIRHTSNINFDYRLDSDTSLVSRVFYPGLSEDQGSSHLLNALQDINMSTKTIGLVLMFPLCSLLITFLRNVIGVKTFGIFMPMLIASACFFTGLAKGAMGFGLLLCFAWLVYDIAERMHLLKTARLAIVLTSVVALLLCFILYADPDIRFELGLLSVFPVVIICFIAESLHQSMSEAEWQETAYTCAGTIVTVLLCYGLFQSMLLKNLFAVLPALFLLVLAAQIYLGKWSGIRLSESLRFKELLHSGYGCVAGINSRNRDIIYRYNDKSLLRLAADKLASKQALLKYNVPVPQTLLTIKEHSGIAELKPCIESSPAFALKPNKGCQGKGILVIQGKSEGSDETTWRGAGGKTWAINELESHVSDILSGSYSQSGDSDVAYIEPLLYQHPVLETIAPFGLSDIRVIVAKGQVLSAMLRIPTKKSKGKANLHQGAIGVAVDIESGLTTAAKSDGKAIEQHPDTGAALVGVQIPFWKQIVNMSMLSYQAIPLAYLGVDICIDKALGALVLEVNGRPGLEIQNVNEKGFYNDFMEKLND